MIILRYVKIEAAKLNINLPINQRIIFFNKIFILNIFLHESVKEYLVQMFFIKTSDESIKNDPPKKVPKSVPSLKERIEQLKKQDEFLEDPMKENIHQPRDEEEEA